MSARLMKKVLKEQEAVLQQHQQLNSDDDAESLNSSPPNRNPFDLLEDEDNNSSDDHSSHHHSDQEKSKISGEASDRGIASKHSATAVNVVPTPNVKAKKKKKKKKIREDLSPRTENEVISSELMLESLTLGASSSGHQKIAPYPAKSQLVNKDSDDIMLKKHCNSSILQVDPKFLSAENELRRIFGSRVVKSHERGQLSVNSRPIRGGRRGNHILKKTVLVSPSQHWPRWDGSLSMELLESKEGVHYFRYIHSSSYAQAQRAFEAAKAIHDLNGIASILLNHPYHIDSLITLADYFKFTGEHQMSADAIAKCLYAMECAWHPLFAPSPNRQLKYIHDTNKPFFSSLFTHMKNMDRRGCHRSALEICKFLLSLDSDDPMGAMLSIDYYALRAEEYAWLEQFAEEYRSDNSLWLFPNFSYSLAVCRFYLEQRELSNNREMVIRKAASRDLMKQALMLHPSVLKKLVVKVPLKDRIWTTLLGNSFFQSEETGSPSLDHLIAIYVERSYIIWRLPDLQKLLSESALSVIEMLKEKGSDAKDWACVRKEAFPSEKNEYAHLLVSDFSDSMPTMPPDNLQDFMVDPQLGGIENRQQFHNNIPENHMPRDLTNRNALAVLFESMLPWINYDAGDGEHDLPEQLNQD
ncbi:Transcription factor 25 [Sesamum alatum]|uniref:Transcription factor 25 n=1 Tax=Sesamum alatum TaxID=300844 RepID=A0AAE1YCC0_9LAMI|nr:Transcription factor 25 [Sesamum alatum]